MIPRLLPSLCCLALLLASPGRAADSTSMPALQPIFNGHDLAGWKEAANNPFWRVENGILVGENNAKLAGNYLWTETSYRDFVLEFDVRWTGEVDTGVECRGPAPGAKVRPPTLQLQLGVSRSLHRDMSGSIYIGHYPEAGQAKEAAKLMKPEGEWNTFRFEARGPRFIVWINGTKAVDYENANYTGAGPLGLQLHPGLKMKVEYRNLRVASLD